VRTGIALYAVSAHKTSPSCVRCFSAHESMRRSCDMSALCAHALTLCSACLTRMWDLGPKCSPCFFILFASWCDVPAAWLVCREAPSSSRAWISSGATTSNPQVCTVWQCRRRGALPSCARCASAGAIPGHTHAHTLKHTHTRCACAGEKGRPQSAVLGEHTAPELDLARDLARA